MPINFSFTLAEGPKGVTLVADFDFNNGSDTATEKEFIKALELRSIIMAALESSVGLADRARGETHEECLFALDVATDLRRAGTTCSICDAILSEAPHRKGCENAV